MPSNWTAMGDSENIKIVTLQPSDQEYTDVTKDFQTQMGANYSTILKVSFLGIKKSIITVTYKYVDNWNY